MREIQKYCSKVWLKSNDRPRPFRFYSKLFEFPREALRSVQRVNKRSVRAAVGNQAAASEHGDQDRVSRRFTSMLGYLNLLPGNRRNRHSAVPSTQHESTRTVSNRLPVTRAKHLFEGCLDHPGNLQPPVRPSPVQSEIEHAQPSGSYPISLAQEVVLALSYKPGTTVLRDETRIRGSTF